MTVPADVEMIRATPLTRRSEFASELYGPALHRIEVKRYTNENLSASSRPTGCFAMSLDMVLNVPNSWRSRQCPHPSSTAIRLQLSLGLDLKNRDEVRGVDERLIFCPLIVTELPVVGSFGKNINPRLERRI